jgi:hypothetical protein
LKVTKVLLVELLEDLLEKDGDVLLLGAVGVLLPRYDLDELKPLRIEIKK